MRSNWFMVGAGLALATIGAAWAQPPTPKKPAADTYHGTTVTDDYRWLENWDDPAVQTWSEAQNTYARSILDKLPSVEAIRQRVTELRGAPQADYNALAFKGGRLFAIKTQPPKQQPMLVTVALGAGDKVVDLASEKIVVDPNQIDSEGLTSIDFFVPSLDGKLVAVSMSEGGSESGTVHVFETATGKKRGDSVPRVNGGTAGGSVAWNADNSGFYYTRYPGAERQPEDRYFYQQVYFHKLGTPTDQDTYEVGKEFPRIAEILLETSDDGKYTTASVSNGDGGDFEHYLRSPHGQWAKIARYDHQVKQTRFGPAETLYLVSTMRAPRGRIIRLPLAEPSFDNAGRLIEPAEPVIEDLVWAGDHLFVKQLVGGPSQVSLFDIRGAEQGFVPTLPLSSVGQMVRIGSEDILLRNESFLSPPAWYKVNANNASPARTAMAKQATVDFADCEVLRQTATSKDGTQVPMTVLRRKGTTMDGTNPTLLWGYGGYGISQSPTYSEIRKLWAEQGGVFVVANIRGGGEFGEEWHKAGNLTHKQNVFDDFYACMKHLVDSGYCTKDKLAIAGGSNGGLLMGAMIAQHPDGCRAVVSSVGIYDMLRVELSPNGQFNITEFGTVKDKAQFDAMYGYSPYHHIRDGATYPTVLMMTGANDPRVDPMQSRKMAARLQAAHPSGRFLLRTSMTSGHGGGSRLSERIEQDVDRYAFLFHALGVAYKPGK